MEWTFGMWRGFHEGQRSRQTVLRRVSRLILNYDLAKGWRTWTGFVEGRRAEEDVKSEVEGRGSVALRQVESHRVRVTQDIVAILREVEEMIHGDGIGGAIGGGNTEVCRVRCIVCARSAFAHTDHFTITV